MTGFKTFIEFISSKTILLLSRHKTGMSLPLLKIQITTANIAAHFKGPGK